MSTDPKWQGTVEGFSRSLSDLTVNSKPHINFLTMIAQENLHQPGVIVRAIQEHLKKTSRIMKLPTLYLIDSIMKNVGKEYINLFSSVLVNEFANIYAEVDKSTRQLMGLLRQTWSGIILPTDLSKLDFQVHTLDQQWQLSSDTLKNTTIKILLNPNFIPQKVLAEDSGSEKHQELNDEVDEAEVLREQLLQQLAKKKEQSEKSIYENNESLLSEEVVEHTCSSDAPINIDLEARENQVDSTTVDKSPELPTQVKCSEMQSATSTVSSPVKTSVTAKQLSSELLEFVSDLIAKQNRTSQIRDKHQTEKRKCRPSERYSRRSDRRSYKKYLRDDASNRRRKEVPDHKPLLKDHQSDQSLPRKERGLSQSKQNQSKVLDKCSDSSVSTTSNSSVPHSSQENPQKYKRPLLPTPVFIQCNEGVLPVQKIQNETIRFDLCHDTKQLSGTSTMKKKIEEIKLQREIDYNHGRGCPSNKLETESQSNSHQIRTEPPRMWPEPSPINVEFQPRQSLINTCFEGPTYLLPPADLNVLGKIAQDTVKPIQLDSETKEIQFYGETAIINSGENEPREITFKPGKASISVNNAVVHTAFNEPGPGKTIFIDGKIFRVHFGAPTRELYVNDEAFQCQFNCPQEIQLSSGEVITVQLYSIYTPLVELGAIRRDLVAGHVTLTIDGTQALRILLHAKPQRFDIDGVPHTLKFADALQSIFINGYLVNIKFGGPPICLCVNGVKHQISLSNVPFDVIPGKVKITNMTAIKYLPCLESSDPYHEPVLPSVRSAKVISMKPNSNDRDIRKQKNRNCDWPPKKRRSGPQPITRVPSAHDGSVGRVPALSYYPNANIHTLFQSLCEVGLLIPKRQTNCLEEDLKVHPVNFKDLLSLKRKQPGLVEQLHSGFQCSVCAVRIPLKVTGVYRKHLDWHFHQNHTTRTKPQSRPWYNERGAWVQLEGFRDVAVIEDEPLPNAGGEDSPRKHNSVPSQGYPPGTVCGLCRDTFDEFFNEDQDEWHLGNCILFEDKLYHPVCLEGSTVKSVWNTVWNTADPVIPFIEREEESVPGDCKVALPSLKNQSVDETNALEINDIEINVVECSPPVICDNSTILEASIPNDNETKLLPSLESETENVRNVCLKPKLVGRKLSQLPPAIKGSETSNMCSIS